LAVKKSHRRELIDAIGLEVRRSQNRTDEYDEAVAHAVGINRTDMRCLDLLAQEGGATAGRLATLMGLTSGAITTVLDRLEAAGFASRVRDENDRRRVQVVLTEKAHTELMPFYEPLHEMSEKLFARYTEEQLELLHGFLVEAGARHDEILAALRERLRSNPG
jgi:DNA-binding MarR family transcriptional regulator